MKQEFDSVGRGYWNCPDLDKKKSSGDTDGPDTEFREPVATKEEANLLSSKCIDGQHRPVLDFDVPARYVASTTPGHGHLYIDKALSWEDYRKLLMVLGEVGILEAGYVGAALRRQATFVRPEWVKKPPKDEGQFGQCAFGKPPAPEPSAPEPSAPEPSAPEPSALDGQGVFDLDAALRETY